MILDKLLEKKDIVAYLELRRDFLRSTLTTEIPKIKPEDREAIKERIEGRISELDLTIIAIEKNTLKDDSKYCYRQLHKNEKVEI